MIDSYLGVVAKRNQNQIQCDNRLVASVQEFEGAGGIRTKQRQRSSVVLSAPRRAPDQDRDGTSEAVVRDDAVTKGLSDALDQSYDPPQPLLDLVW